MITTTFMAIFAYAYSVYQIRIASGSWRKFNPLHVPVLPFMLFIMGTTTLLCTVIILYIRACETGLIP